MRGHGLLLLKQRSKTKLARQVGRVLTPEHKGIFWPAGFPHAHLVQKQMAGDELLHYNCLLWRGEPQYRNLWRSTRDLHLLYQWFGPSKYVRRTRLLLLRTSRLQLPSAAQRFREHLLRNFKRLLATSARLRRIALGNATSRKRRQTYPELSRSRRCRLVVFDVEVGGRWATEAASFLRMLRKTHGFSDGAVSFPWLRKERLPRPSSSCPAKPMSVLPDLSRLCTSSSRMPVGSRARP